MSKAHAPITTASEAHMEVPSERLCCKKELLDRGWTPAMIDRLLGQPDATRTNPHYQKAAPMKLYNESRVSETEHSDEFRKMANAAALRRESAKKVAARKREELLAEIERIEIKIPTLSREELTARACEHYNAVARERSSDCGGASPASDPAFLARISVNYLRHCLTSYEEELGKIAGRGGVQDGYLLINETICDAIELEYDYLTSECRRQMKMKWEAAYA